MSPQAVESGRQWLLRGGLVFIGIVIGLGLGAAIFRADGIPGGVPGTDRTDAANASKFSGPLTPGTTTKRADDATKNALAAPGVVSFEAEIQVALRDVVDSRRAVSVQAAVQKLTKADIAQAFERAQTLPFQDRSLVINMIASRWAELDPAGAAAGVMALAEPGSRQAALIAVAQRWAVDAPDEAFQWLNANVPGSDQRVVFTGLLDFIARSNAPRAIAILQQIPPSRRELLLNDFDLYTRWTQQDPFSASAAAAALPSGEQRWKAIGGVAYAWAETDPEAALAWAAEISQPNVRAHAFSQAIHSWAEHSPEAALAWMQSMERPNLQTELIQSVLTRFAQTDAAAAREYALSRTGPERNRAISSVALAISTQDLTAAMQLVSELPRGTQAEVGRQVLINLSSDDPKAAAELLQSLPPLIRDDHALEHIAMRWGQSDPAASIAWLSQMPTTPSRKSALSSVVFQWARNAPAAAAAWYTESAGAVDHDGLEQSIAGAWAHEDEQAAISWAEKLGDEQRAKALAAALDAVAQHDPVRGGQIIARLPAERQAQAANGIAEAWAQSDPAAAARWVSAMPPERRQEALNSVLRTWTRTDAAGAAAWIQTFPAGEERDGMVQTFAEAVVQADPEGALEWAATVNEEERRRTLTQQLAGKWKEFDRAGATKWIQSSSSLPADAKEKLLK